jgi:diguanylate cyclase
MSKTKPTYQELEKRLAVAEPIIKALKNHEVDAVVGEEKIAFLLLREVAEALRISEAGFRAMFDLSGVGMIQADTPGLRFTKVNQKFCEITGYSAEELLTKTYLGLTHPDDHHGGMNELARVLRGKTDSWSIEKRCVRKDGSVIWVAVNGAALRDATGRAVRIMAMISDITARKQAEQEQRDRSAEKGKPTRRKKAAVKTARESVSRKSSDKPRPERR